MTSETRKLDDFHLPQIIVALAENGDLVTELPGPSGSRRRVVLLRANALPRGQTEADYDWDKTALVNFADAYERGYKQALAESFETAVRTILQGRAGAKFEIGTDGAPTQAQVEHWRHAHASAFKRDDCKFCQSERQAELEAGAKERTRNTRGAILSDFGGVVVRRLNRHGQDQFELERRAAERAANGTRGRSARKPKDAPPTLEIDLSTPF